MVDAYIAAHAADQRQRFYDLFKIEFGGGTVYWTECDVPVFALSQTWTPRPIKHSGINSRQGEIAGTASLWLGDADLVATAIALAGSLAGTVVSVYRCYLEVDGDNTISQGTKLIFYGRIEAPESEETGDQTTITLSLGPPADFQSSSPPMEWSLTCQTWYKSPACQATGSDTVCNGTTAACSATTKVSPPAGGGNLINFVGIPFLQLQE